MESLGSYIEGVEVTMSMIYFIKKDDDYSFSFDKDEEGWVVLKEMTLDEHKAFIQDLNKAGYRLSADGDDNPIMIPYVHQWTEAERTSERKRLHEATDNDYAKYARQVRCNIGLEHSQAVLDYIDQYNLAVSDTVNQPNYPQEVSYPEYTLP